MDAFGRAEADAGQGCAHAPVRSTVQGRPRDLGGDAASGTVRSAAEACWAASSERRRRDPRPGGRHSGSRWRTCAWSRTVSERARARWAPCFPIHRLRESVQFSGAQRASARVPSSARPSGRGRGREGQDRDPSQEARRSSGEPVYRCQTCGFAASKAGTCWTARAPAHTWRSSRSGSFRRAGATRAPQRPARAHLAISR